MVPSNAVGARSLSLSGLLATALLVSFLFATTGTPAEVPNPGPVMLLGVVYAAYSGGYATGSLSAFISFLYFFWFFADPHGTLNFAPTNLRRLIVFGIVTPVMVLLIGELRRKADRALAAERESAELRDRLRQAQKIEAVGHLTGGVAHDFNNLLTVVTGSLEMIRAQPSEPERVLTFVARGLSAVSRGQKLTAQLLAFARRQILHPEAIDPNRLIQEFVPLIGSSIAAANIDIAYDLEPDIYPALVDPTQFQAALLNLIVNARDAMAPAGGRITIETRNVGISADRVPSGLDLAPGCYIKLVVSDTGAGMTPDVQARAFEPFFTTKDVGKGTGLGLSQVYGFTTQSGGAVRIESEAGRGTRIVLYLRRAEDPAATDRRSDITAFPAIEGQENILVVDDDEDVLANGLAVLQELGYRTSSARCASEALAILRDGPRIDVMFSDIVMPGGMHGVELAAEAVRLRPNLKVLLTSGYAAAGEPGDQAVQNQPFDILAKPYRREELAAKLRGVVAKAKLS